MQKKSSVTGVVMLLCAAIIWGTSFVAQRVAAGLIDSLAFNSIRIAIGAAVLIPVFLIDDAIKRAKGRKVIGFNRATIVGGVICGVAVFFATTLQQIGLETTTAGKSGFITALYVVIVPVVGLLARRKTPIIGWFALPIAILGFWLMSVGDHFSVTIGDLYTLLCAVLFSLQILFLDTFGEDTDPIKLTFTQFVVAACIGLPIMAATGVTPDVGAVKASIIPILYVGVLSCGIAYTFQASAQQRVEPALATLLMSLESVFSLLGGMIVLRELSSVKEMVGCLLVFGAVLLAEQNPVRRYLLPLTKQEKDSIFSTYST